MKTLAIGSALILSALLITKPVNAAPSGFGSIVGGGAAISTTAAPLPPDITNQSLYTPIASIPGKVGSVSFSYHNGCAFIIMGGSATPEQVDALLKAGGKGSTRGFGKGYFALLSCAASADSTNIILANERALRRIGKRGARNQPGSLFAANFDQANTLASAILANVAGSGSGKFFADAYELILGTDASKQPYMYIIDKVGGKIIGVGPSGAYHANWDSEMKALFARTLYVNMLDAPRVIIAND